MADLQICFHEIKHEADVGLVSKGVKQLQTQTIILLIWQEVHTVIVV